MANGKPRTNQGRRPFTGIWEYLHVSYNLLNFSYSPQYGTNCYGFKYFAMPVLGLEKSNKIPIPPSIPRPWWWFK